MSWMPITRFAVAFIAGALSMVLVALMLLSGSWIELALYGSALLVCLAVGLFWFAHLDRVARVDPFLARPAKERKMPEIHWDYR